MYRGLSVTQKFGGGFHFTEQCRWLRWGDWLMLLSGKQNRFWPNFLYLLMKFSLPVSLLLSLSLIGSCEVNILILFVSLICLHSSFDLCYCILHLLYCTAFKLMTAYLLWLFCISTLSLMFDFSVYKLYSVFAYAWLFSIFAFVLTYIWSSGLRKMFFY